MDSGRLKFEYFLGGLLMTLVNGERKVYIWTLFTSVVRVKVFGLSDLANGISGLLGFFIFNSDSNLMKCSEVRVMGKDHLSFKVG